jgi:hypothetical protein
MPFRKPKHKIAQFEGFGTTLVLPSMIGVTGCDHVV